MKKLIDACVLIALLNTQDKFHNEAQKWFIDVITKNEKQHSVSIVVLSSTPIEVNTKIRKLNKENKFTPAPAFTAQGQENYPIDQNFLDKVQNLKIYDEFLDKLGSQDATYAAVAFIEQMTLVTFDRGFKKVQDKIEVEFL